jgi:class 3 adenylate cyclase
MPGFSLDCEGIETLFRRDAETNTPDASVSKATGGCRSYVSTSGTQNEIIAAAIPSAHRNMSAEAKKEIQLEIARVLFIDIVGYSKRSINEQRAVVDELTQTVRATEQFEKAEAVDRLIKIATGDGMALVFYTSPEAPVRCAMELSRALKEHPRLSLRMGIHSGPVRGVVDVTGRTNLAGAGLNVARRVMDCGDAGHIFCPDTSRKIWPNSRNGDRFCTILAAAK